MIVSKQINISNYFKIHGNSANIFPNKKIEKEGKILQYIGKIDIKLFEKISKNIVTDEVVLTNKQKEHIKERHPQILEKYSKYFTEIIEKPDLILKDKIRKNTALLLKTIKQEVKGKTIVSINLVLRLAVIDDNKNNKNCLYF